MRKQRPHKRIEKPKRRVSTLSDLVFIFHDTKAITIDCVPLTSGTLKLSPIDIAIISAENLPEATGLYS